MEEIVYTIDNWTIIKIVGGLSAILSGIFYLFNKLLIERIKITWENQGKQKLEEIKSYLSSNNQAINNLQNYIVQHQQNISNKKYESIDKAWNLFLDVNNNLPSPLALPLYVLKDDSITNEVLNKKGNKNSSLGNLIKSLDEIHYLDFILNASKELETIRPYLNKNLFFYLRTYFGILGTIFHRMYYDYKYNTLKGWKSKDIEDKLKEVFTKEQVEYVMNNTSTFKIMKDIFESYIVTNINNTINGTDFTVDTIDKLKKMETAWKMPTNITDKDL